MYVHPCREDAVSESCRGKVLRPLFTREVLTDKKDAVAIRSCFDLSRCYKYGEDEDTSIPYFYTRGDSEIMN